MPKNHHFTISIFHKFSGLVPPVVRNLMRVRSVDSTTPAATAAELNRPSTLEIVQETFSNWRKTTLPHNSRGFMPYRTVDVRPLDLRKPIKEEITDTTPPEQQLQPAKKLYMCTEIDLTETPAAILQRHFDGSTRGTGLDEFSKINTYFPPNGAELAHGGAVPLNRLLNEPFVTLQTFIAFYMSHDFLYVYTDAWSDNNIYPPVGFLVEKNNSQTSVIDDKQFKTDPLFLPNSYDHRALDIWPDTEFVRANGNSIFLNRLAGLVSWILRRLSSKRVDQYWCLDLYVNGAPVRSAIHWDNGHSGLEKFEKSGLNKARLSSICLRFSNRLASGTLRYYIKKALFGAISVDRTTSSNWACRRPTVTH